MKQDESKMVLAEKATVEAQKAHSAAVEGFLDPEKRGASNVVGMGVGVKWKKGQPTGEPALVVLVTQKLDKEPGVVEVEFREGVVPTISLAALGASVALSSPTGTNPYTF